MFSDELQVLATNVLDAARSKNLTIATAESCTAGLIAGCLTDIAGSSDVVERGFVVYSNAAKTEMLGVPKPLIDKEGAVSEPVVRKLVEGIFDACDVDLAVSVSGIAGPGGATPGKPVGLVHFAVGRRGSPIATTHHVYPGDRSEVREKAVYDALELLLGAARSAP